VLIGLVPNFGEAKLLIKLHGALFGVDNDDRECNLIAGSNYYFKASI